MDDDRLKRALSDLQRETRQLQRLRADYDVITRSRLYGLRAAWQGLKAFFGAATVDDGHGNVIPLGLPQSALPPAITEAALVELWNARMTRSTGAEPVASVVIPVFNHLDETLRCLFALAQAHDGTPPLELILVDDASTDRTREAASALRGLEYVRNETNLGFVGACNAGAARARGRYLCFLNNDTLVRAHWLEHLVATAERDETIGAVGAKLLYPDGRLQEAGAIIWQDATGWNYGRNADPTDPRYCYVRDVDYCSGAALLVRRDLFERLGGFSKEFSPAYYEDADLCFAIRSAGYRVVYQPEAEVVHVEGATCGTEATGGVKRFQEINRAKFLKKWRAELASHEAPGATRVPAAARRFPRAPRVLVVDSYVPLYDREAGSQRLLRIVELLRNSGLPVAFLPDNYACLQPYTSELQRLGVEVLYHTDGGRSREDALAEILPLTDVAWICRPELFRKFAPLFRSLSKARLVYDTIDLHFVRKRREAELLGLLPAEWRSYETIELAAAHSADATVVVTEEERAILAERGCDNVNVIPTIHDPAVAEPSPFAQTAGLLFIGNYNHPPNADAVRWLCSEIMPVVWKQLPNLELTLLGSDPPAAVRELASERVAVPGFVADVSPYFRKARLFVAPLRFGAGMKGKVGHAMSYALPVIVTSVGAEGFGITDGIHARVIDDAPQFARAIVDLYGNEQSWNRIARASLEKSREFSGAAVATPLLRLLENLSRAPARQRVGN